MEKNKLVLFLPSIEGGGVEKNFKIIADYLAKKFNKIILITSSNDIKFNNSKIQLLTIKNEFFKSKSRTIKILLCLIILVREIISNKKTLVFSFQANLYAILVCKIFNTKIIIRSNSSPSGWSTNSFKKNIFKILFKYPKAIIVNSIDFKKEMRKIFNIDSKCIFNPLNKLEIIQKSKKKITQKIYQDKKSFKLISVGRLVDQKDHITLLKAFKLIHLNHKIELLIIGRGRNKEIIRNFICENELKKKIKLIDYVKNPFPYIKLSDVLILSSKYEGLPNVLLEALTLGKPVISSNCPTGPNEILSNGKGGQLFKIGDYKSLSKKIVYLMKNYSQCMKKTKHAISKLNRYDKKKNLNEYYKLILKVMS